MGSKVIDFVEIAILSNGDIHKTNGVDVGDRALSYAKSIAPLIDFERYEEDGLKEAVAYVGVYKDEARLSIVSDGRSERLYVEKAFTSKWWAMQELKTKVLKGAKDKDWVPTRDLLDEIGKHLPAMALKDPMRAWWVEMLMSHLNGHDSSTRKTRNANQMLLLAEKPQVRDEDDWSLAW